MKNLIVLGVSGSIGKQTIAIVKKYPDKFSLIGASVHHSIAYLEELISLFPSLRYACVGLEKTATTLSKKYPKIRFFFKEEGLIELVRIQEDALVVNALVGFVGLQPTIAAIRCKKHVALANKETLVCAGEIVQKELKIAGVCLYPIDSEHSAIYQCLVGEEKKDIKRIVITGSGGPFRDLPLEALQSVSKEQALHHPNWQMGAKITIDSATLINKALEIIEAHYLFDLPYEKIEAVLHYESIVHGLVEFSDGSIKASLGAPSMEIPILYALNGCTARLATDSLFDLQKQFELRFRPFDPLRFEAIALAYEVGKQGGTLPCVLNAANEVAVAAFLEDKILFDSIIPLIKKTLAAHRLIENPTLDAIIKSDAWARRKAKELMTLL